MINDLCHRSC